MGRWLRKLLGAREPRRVAEAPLPLLTEAQRVHAARLRETFERLPVLPLEGALPSDVAWRENQNRLRELVLTEDAAGFLRWDVIRQTMFVPDLPYVREELAWLRGRKDWETRWQPATRESAVGHPPASPVDAGTSGTLIHHAYHVARFEEATGLRVDELECVLEFGGGYGSLCRLFHALGFGGRYAILDLAPFSALQRFFLACLDLGTLDAARFVDSPAGIWCGSDLGAIEAALPSAGEEAGSLFVATWSLSEVPLSVRDALRPRLAAFGAWLLGYQERFGEVDNVTWFEALRGQVPAATWQRSRIAHLPGNHYLFGRRSTPDPNGQ